MKLPSLRLWSPVLGSLVLAGAAFAQLTPSLENDVRNVYSQQPKVAWPPTPAPADPLTATGTQFKGGTVVGGFQTTRIFSTGSVVFSRGLNAASYGVVWGASDASYPLANAFDGNATTMASLTLGTGTSALVGINAGRTWVVTGLSIVLGTGSPLLDPITFTLYGNTSASTTGMVQLAIGMLNPSLGRNMSSSIVPVSTSTAYQYYLVSLVPRHNASRTVQVAEVELYGAGTPSLLAGLAASATTGTLTLPAGIPVGTNGTPLAGQGVREEYARLSTPLVSRQVSYLLGDVIAPPVYDVSGKALASQDQANYYLPQPQNSAAGRFYYSPHAGKVFATQPGVVDVVWVVRTTGATNTRSYVISATPAKAVRKMYWTENGFKGPIVRVPTSRVSTLNVVYNSFFPASVDTPYVRPGEVPDPNVPSEKRTLWLSTLDNSLHAYNAEGRVFVELLGALNLDGTTRVFLGSEIVEVAKEIVPSVQRINIGDELLPLNNETLESNIIAGTIDFDGMGAFLHQKYSQATGKMRLFAVRQTTPLVVNGVELPSNEVLIYWMERGDLSLLWPKYYAGYIFNWPDDSALYSTYVRSADPAINTAVQLNSADNPTLVYQDDPTKVHAPQISTTFQFFTYGSGRSLIRYTNGDDIWFERVWSKPDTAFTGYTGTPVAWDVGKRITPPTGSDADSYVGYIRQASGTAFNTHAYKDPFVVGFDEAKKGAIIGVNALPNQNVLEVWWYSQSTPAGSTIKGTFWPSFVQKYQLQWPTQSPALSGTIVLASNNGSGELTSIQAQGSIYYQNNSALPGYNPNEEHAMMIGGRAYAIRDDLNLASSSSAYVLVEYTEADERPAMLVFKVQREDLTNGYSFTYTVEAGKVLQAPMPLPLLPLPLRTDYSSSWTWHAYFPQSTGWFPLSKNTEMIASHEVVPTVSADPPANPDLTEAEANSDAPRYGQFTYLDRKGTQWVYRGAHDGVSTTKSFQMRYFYPMQPGFYFPSLVAGAQPAAGTVLPYLRQTPTSNPDNSIYGEPLKITYRPIWPASVPQLQVGETLARAKYGLPALRGQTSAELIYEQAIALSPKPASGAFTPLTSATLFDPTRAKTYSLKATTLAALPDSAATDVYLGKTYFTRLPPHLSQRFYLDPNIGTLGALVLKGVFNQAALGEDYMLLNVLSTADVAALKGLVDDSDQKKTAWNNAIDGLATTVQTFKEDPAKRGTYIVDATLNTVVNGTALAAVNNDDTAVDSYAISAVGGGSGYVVLLVGGGKAFTPVNEPVSMYIFKVASPLYRGELKIVQSSNPLDEKLTLQHSSDFAGSPIGYDFRWMYSPPVNGFPPAVYTYARCLVLGNSNNWKLFTNATTAYATLRAPASGTNAALMAIGVSTTTPANVVINDPADAAGSGTTLPQAILRNQFDYPAPYNTGTALPLRSFLSVQLGNHDGADVYLNGALVAVINRSGDNNTGTVAQPASDFQPLPLLYELPPTLLRPTNNVVSVELYTDADVNVASAVNVRIEALAETENTAAWIPLTAAGDETAGTVTGSVRGKVRHVIQGNSILTLTDNYFIMQYRARDGSNAAYVANGGWSKWTDPQLAEGWIKRALAGINPFSQRASNLFSNSVNTDVSLVQQAGRRWQGDIALNLANINNFGLIEIYETILRRGKALSIEGAVPISYSPANDALLLAAGYLSDLYMIVGNEAYADAANPTIAFSADSGSALAATYGDVATSLFAFKGQLATLADEELTLLRGRDNSLQPGTQTTPIYNRLVWNYTRGINSGEVIYALNYNIKDMNSDGAVDATDAAILYPQGHGDAYGHYLTALSGYYGLLANANFTWTPRTEAVTVLGKPVQVDYFDERKFATAAVAVGRTASQIIDLTYRQAFSAATTGTWGYLKDGTTYNGVVRRWGVDDWATRGGQGAYFHWLTGNSLLPAVDGDPTHQGITKVDRTTVPELTELVTQATAVQQSLSNADAKLNPLGLANGALVFDISPAQVDAGQTHFEQIYSRATTALQNAIAAFNNAKTSTQFLREQEDSLAKTREAINQQEQVYTNQLIGIFGTPYADDIGVGKTYTQDYAGPDLLHYQYIDMPEAWTSPDAQKYTVWLDPQFNESMFGYMNYGSDTVTFTVDSSGQYQKPGDWTGRRASPGQVQTLASDVLLARMSLQGALGGYQGLLQDMTYRVKTFQAAVDAHSDLKSNMKKYQILFSTMDAVTAALETAVQIADAIEKTSKNIAASAVEAFPTVVGMANDVTSAGRAAVMMAGIAAQEAASGTAIATDTANRFNSVAQAAFGRLSEIEQEDIAWAAEYEQQIFDLRDYLNGLLGQQGAADVALRQYDQAVRNYRAKVAEGDRVQAERATFRARAAALVQGYRTKDAAFRAFRDEALEKYKQLLDLSSRYAYLAASAYDYETGLLNATGSSTAATFMDKIVKSRAPGVVVNGVPQFGGATSGDPGLAGALAQMNSDWLVVKSRMGFNNPDRYSTTFSLRSEAFRILSGTDGDAAWRAILLSARRDNLMDDADAVRYCLNLGLTTDMAVPGFIIQFSTTIGDGFNFFGQPLAGGDSTYSSSSFATKIRASGIALTGYVGMTSPSSTASVVTAIGGTSPSDPYTAYNDPKALSATPYVYLIPAGSDSMRSPVGNGTLTRTWSVQDQAIPLPFNIGGTSFGSTSTWTAVNSLSEGFTVRQHQAFRAVPDGTVFTSGPGFTNARLIGRSVWNSRWKIIIPGKTLLADPKAGMQNFIESVKDIKLHFESYSNAGN